LPRAVADADADRNAHADRNAGAGSEPSTRAGTHVEGHHRPPALDRAGVLAVT
jgi:hypothetical protein